MSHHYLLVAALSGVFAALASMFSKLTLSNYIEELNLCQYGVFLEDIFAWKDCTYVVIPLRVVMFFGLILSNLMMWRTFSKAMAMSPTTLEITMANTASNFIISAWIGFLFFGETFSIMWFMGVTLIIVGTAVLHQSSVVGNEEEYKVE